MKRLLAMTVACLAACGDNLAPPDPVDMTFVADVTELRNTCDDRPLKTSSEAFVDAYLHADGTVQLTTGESLIPGPGSFPNVRPHGGSVDYDAQRYSSYPDKTYPYHIEGSLSMDGMDLTVTEHWYKASDFSDCLRQARVVGKPRGFRDAGSLDGRYEIQTSYYGVVCGTDPWPSQPLGQLVYVLDAHPTAGGVVLVLADAVYLEVPMPDAESGIDWNGTVYLAAPDGIEELEGGLQGRFTPSHLHADLSFRTPDLAPGCRHAYLLHGDKRAADPVEVGNDYRAVYRLRDSCAGTVVSYEASLTLVRQSPTEIEVKDDWGDWFIDADGASLYETDGSPSEGEVGTFTGTADPPYASYTLEFETFHADGTSCVYGWDVDAAARYAPEVEWTPAFLPDPPKPAAARRLARPGASGPLAAPVRALGPLIR
jgi:hypothetical protein